jgi:hypothetical protein
LSVVPALNRSISLQIAMYFDVGILNRIGVKFVQFGCITLSTDYVSIEKLAKEKSIAQEYVGDHLVWVRFDLFI